MSDANGSAELSKPIIDKDSPIVISLGGSLVAPAAGPDAQFVQQFVNIIGERQIAGARFYIIVGGGKVCRHYQDALKSLGKSDDELDYMGIYATHFNAHFVALAFGLDPEHKVVLKSENLTGKEVLHVTGAGLKPGQSSDAAAITTAVAVGASIVYNLSNVSHVYSADPDRESDARPYDHLDWSKYLELIPSEWNPGLSSPFDPIASRAADEHGIEVRVLGSNLENFAAALAGKNFTGTTISN